MPVLLSADTEMCQLRATDLSTGQATRTTDLPGAPSGLSLAPAADHVAVACDAVGVVIIAVASHAVVKIIELADTNAVAYSPSGKHLALVSLW